MRAFTHRTTGVYGRNHRKAGRPVRLFFRVGRRFAHVEIRGRAWHVSTFR